VHYIVSQHITTHPTLSTQPGVISYKEGVLNRIKEVRGSPTDYTQWVVALIISKVICLMIRVSSPKKELTARTRRLPTKLPLKRHIPIWLTIPADTLLHFVRLHLYLPQHTPTPKNPNREITDTLLSWLKMYTYIPHKKLTAFAPSSLLCAITLPKHHPDEL